MIAAVDRVLAEREGANPVPLARIGLTAAVVLHLALVAAAILGPGLTERDREPIEFMPVVLVPAQALGTGRTPPAPEPEPEPAAPVPEEVEEPEPEPEPEVSEPAMPAPEPGDAEPRAEPQPSRPPATPAAPAAEESRPGDRPGSPAGSPTGTSGLGATLAGVGDPSFTYGYYLDRMLALIERNWRRPPTGDLLPEVALTFTIARDGRVSDLEIDASSGINTFDLAGLRAVENASPLPPLPAGYRKDSLSVRLIIR